MKKNEPISKVLTKDVVTTHVAQKVSDVRKLCAEHARAQVARRDVHQHAVE